MSDYHEGDMAEDLVDYWMQYMPVQELLTIARKALEEDVKSWPTEKIREQWKGLVGEPDET